MQIKDLAIGDGYVCLMEGSTKVKFTCWPTTMSRA